MPGPTFTRPPAPDTGETARRLAFDTLLSRRVEAIIAPAAAAGPVGQGPQHPTVARAQLLEALVREFVGAVEQANSSRALLRQRPIEYVDAVVLNGSAGRLVVDAVEYDAAPVYSQARAGEVDSIVHGADLDAYLRTGDRRYAERLGLA